MTDLAVDVTASVIGLRQVADEADAAILRRLVEIGFVPGEAVRVIAHGFPGLEPIAVRLGGTTFALRRYEADFVLIDSAHLARDS